MLTHKLALPLTLLILAASPSSADEQKELARKHFQKGQTEYDLGNFDVAAAEWAEAYRLFSSPAFLFNLGQANRKLGNTERALFFYRGYLRNMPDAPNRAEVEQWIAELEGAEEAVQEPEPAADPEPPSTPDVESTAMDSAVASSSPGRSELRRIGYWTLGASGAVLAASLVLGVLAKSKSDELENAGADGDVYFDATEGLRSNGENLEKATIVTLAVGGAGAIAGGVLVWMGWPRPAEVAIGPSGLMIHGRF